MILYHFELFGRGCDLGHVGRICTTGQVKGTCDIEENFGHLTGNLRPVGRPGGTKRGFSPGQPLCDTGQTSDFGQGGTGIEKKCGVAFFAKPSLRGLTNYVSRHKSKYGNMMSLSQALFASTKPQHLTSLANPLYRHCSRPTH